MPSQLPCRPSLLTWPRSYEPATCRSVIERYSTPRRPLRGTGALKGVRGTNASGACPSISRSEHAESNSNKRLIPAPLHFPWGQPCAAGAVRPLASRCACGAEITCRPSVAAADWTGSTVPAAALLAGRIRLKSNSTAGRAGAALCSPPGLAGTAALDFVLWCIVCQAANWAFWRLLKIEEKQYSLQLPLSEVFCGMLTVLSAAMSSHKN